MFFERKLENMMSQEISLTFGPLEELKKIIADNSDRQFKLFLATDSTLEYMLLDYSGKKTLFHSGLNYNIEGVVGDREEKPGYIECRYVTLNEDEQKVFKSIFNSWNSVDKRPTGLTSSVMVHSMKDNFEFLLINAWEDENTFMVWNNEKSNQMNQFGHDGNATPVVKTYRLM